MNDSVVRTYYDFSISYGDFVDLTQSLESTKKYHIEQGVAKICSDCVQNGFYILALERGFIEFKEFYTPTIKKYRLSLGVYVRPFAPGSLTIDEIYYYSRKGTEQILFELDRSRVGESYGLYDATTVSNSKPTQYSLEKLKLLMNSGVLTMREVKEAIMPQLYRGSLEDGTFTDKRPMIKYTYGIDLAQEVDKNAKIYLNSLDEKPKQYNIIRRPKCSNTSG